MKGIDLRIVHGGAALLAGIVLLCSWHGGYRSAERVYRKETKELADLSERIAQWEARAQTAGGQQAWLARHRQRLDQLKARFPTQRQLPHALDTLVDALKAGEIKVLNITQGNVEPASDAGGSVLIDGVPCDRLPLAIAAEGRYRAILEAMERITGEAVPAIVSIEQVELRATEAGGAKLSATMRLHLYLVGSITDTTTPNHG